MVYQPNIERELNREEDLKISHKSNSELVEELNEMNLELSESQDEIERLESELAIALEDRDEFYDRLGRANDYVDELECQISDLECQIFDLTEDYDELEHKYEKLEQKCKGKR